MLALIYLALAIALGDLVCRRFYRFVSVPHRCAAAVLVGILLSTWFTYLAWLAFAHTAEPLLSADVLFFIVAAGAVFWLSRKAPKVDMIAPRAPGSSRWDWITLAALFAAACVLLIGTLYVNKQGRLRLSGALTSDLGPQLAFAQSFGLGHNFPAGLPHHAIQRSHDQFLFYFQAGNLEFLGLNLDWSVNVLSVLVLTSMLALVMALGELLFNSRVVGRLGATLFFFHSPLRRFTNFLPSGYPHRDETWGFWKQIAFVNQRHLPFAIGIFVLVLIFLVDRYRQRSSATAVSSDAKTALRESKGRSNWNPIKTSFFSKFITSARAVKSFVFSGLLLAALPLWNASLFLAAAVVLCCLFVAYGCWCLSRLKTPAMLGGVLAGTLTACILAAGVIDLLAVYSSSRVEINYEREPLVKGLVLRSSVIYKIPDSFAPGLVREGSSKLPVTAFVGGKGNGRCQFDNPRGLAVDSGGNIFVADTNNARIQKFSPNGTFVISIGTKGKGPGQLGAPNGIAISRAGKLYVADVGNHRVQKLAPDGRLIAEWSPALYGPQRIAIGPNDSIYVADQGHARIVKLNLDGEVVANWGGGGTGDGQFRDPTSVAVDPTTNKVYVADPINSRIQVFDSNGKFLTKWSIPEWGQAIGFEDLAVDPDRGRLYASSAYMRTILIFDLQGNRVGTVTPALPDKLEAPSALALAKDKLFVLNTASARVSVIVLQNR
jgi:DNA-binding beta-propeller fold protein YncE